METVRKNIHGYEYLSEESKIIIELIWPDGDYPKGSSLFKSAKRHKLSLDEYLLKRFNSSNPKTKQCGGRKLTAAEKQHLSDFWKGKKKSEEHTLHIRRAKEGDRNPMYGKERSEETKDKYRAAIAGRGFLGVSSHIVRWYKSKEDNSDIIWSDIEPEELKRIKKEFKTENDKHRSQESLDRFSAENTSWRKAVFKRDNFTCQKTGIKGGSLHAHHIWSFKYNPLIRFSIPNGITLSNHAHREFHTLYGKTGTTMEQLEEWLGRSLGENRKQQLGGDLGWALYEYGQGLSDYDENGNYYWDD